jgi:tryptophanyl-tRNA synthetase
VGLRGLGSAVQGKTEKASKAALAAFKQYREKDGLFYFKLVDTAGVVLLQSKGFESPKVAGQAIGQLQREGAAGIAALQAQLEAQDATALASTVQALAALADAAEKK